LFPFHVPAFVQGRNHNEAGVKPDGILFRTQKEQARDKKALAGFSSNEIFFQAE
jgi:hypothetical protein